MIAAADVLHDLETFVYRRVAASYPERLARACARAMLDCLYLNFRAQKLYVPTQFNEHARSRYEQIWAEFTGNNYDVLACKYKLSLQRIYIIVNQMRKTHVQKRQSDLFAADLKHTDNRPLAQVVFETYLPHELERVGLASDDASQLATACFDHLCAHYPGILISITEAHRQAGQHGDLFDMAESEPV